MKEPTNAELVEKLKDNRYFIERFFYIIDKSRKSCPFLFNPPQADYYANKTLNDLILKARKEGFSSAIEADFLVDCLTKQNQNAVTMAHTWEDTMIHLDRVDYYLQHMGFPGVPFRVTLDKNNQREISFPKTNSVYWIGTAGSRAFGRGRDITHFHGSEVAWWENQDVITAVLEACVPGARKVLETTGNGLEMFYRMWQEAGDTQSGSPWKKHFYPWWVDGTNVLPLPVGVNFRPTSTEERMKKAYSLSNEQLYWWRSKRAEMPDKTKMPQEYPSAPEEAFLFGGRQVFDMEKLAVMLQKARQTKPQEVGELEDDGAKIGFRSDPEGPLTVFKMPRSGRSYLVCADSSEGVPDGDYSVAHVLDRASWECVATFRGRPDPGTFGLILCRMGYFWNNAILAPELNNHGWATVERIKTEKYPHLINTKTIWPDDTPRDGFPVLNDKIKNMVITALRKSVDDMTVPVWHQTTIQEMQTYVQDDHGRMNAQKGCHDDCVTSLAIGVYCLKFLAMDETYAERAKTSLSGFQFTGSAREERVRRSRAGY